MEGAGDWPLLACPWALPRLGRSALSLQTSPLLGCPLISCSASSLPPLLLELHPPCFRGKLPAASTLWPVPLCVSLAGDPEAEDRSASTRAA